MLTIKNLSVSFQKRISKKKKDSVQTFKEEGSKIKSKPKAKRKSVLFLGYFLYLLVLRTNNFINFFTFFNDG